MDTQTLKVFTAHYVAESDIETEDKMELFEIIKLAEKSDLLSLLSFGELEEVTTENISILSETEIEIDRMIFEADLDEFDASSMRGAMIRRSKTKQKTDAALAAAKKLKDAAGKKIGAGYRSVKGAPGKAGAAWKAASGKKKAGIAVGAVAAIAAAVAAKKALKKRKCTQLAQGDSAKFSACMG